MRSVVDTIDKMIDKIPEGNEKFLSDLRSCRESAVCRAPELVLTSWNQLSDVVNGFIDDDPEEWEYEVLSIFTTKSVDVLKELNNA